MKNKLKTFIKQNGFLLFLFICVCVVAAGTIFVSTQDFREARNDREEDLVILEEVSSIDQDEVDKESGNDDIVTEEELVNEPINEVANEDDLSNEKEVSNEDELAEETINEEIEFIDDYEEEEDDTDFVTDNHTASYLPVEGEIMAEFSDDKLIYSSTLDEWRHHAGIDIKASLGTKVKAPLSGTVKEVREDDLWGIIIVIDHGDGLESRFSNLGTLEMVKPGISVKAGDYISTVGETAKIEMKAEPHLHYELTKNGKNIDPRSITN